MEGALSPNNCAMSEARLSGEAGAPTQWVAALLMEGALSPNNCAMSEASLSREAP
jgi:hypothetical protein